MEVLSPSPAGGEFNFNSACTSPYVTAPSSPQPFGNYFFTTAPTSPITRASAFNQHPSPPTTAAAATTAYNWEEKPNSPTAENTHYDSDQNYDTDFEFDFAGNFGRRSISADELFDGGKIKPFKPPLNLHNSVHIRPDSAKLPKKRSKTKIFDPFPRTMEEGRRPEKIPVTAWYSKLKLKDLLVFRNASEGHKGKYAVLKKSNDNEDVKSWSFRSAESGGPVSGRRQRRQVSAHEWHYTMKRAAAEEMKRKTYLPYKRGLFGCLGFNANTMHGHDFSKRRNDFAMSHE